MSSLYELIGERLALQNKLQEQDFDEQTILDTLEGDSVAIQKKIEDYCYVIRNMESLPAELKAEEQRLAIRRKVYENRVEHIKNWLLTNMQAANITRIETTAFTIAIQANPPAVVVDDESVINEDYWRQPEPPPPVLDKKAIAQAIKDGKTVYGAHLEQSVRLVIK